MTTILHISDIHFGLKDGKESFLEDVGEELLRQAAALRPDVLVVSGDLSIKALPEELSRAKAYIDRFPVASKLVIPGNHDARGDAGLATFRELVGPTEPSLHVPGAVLVGIDSTEEDAEELEKGRATQADWEKAQRMSKGYVGPEQYPRIERELASAAPGEARIAVIHHHLVAIPGVGIDTDPLIDSGDMLELLIRSRVHFVLAGHKHRPWCWDVNGLRILHSGTSTSRRYKQGINENFYNVLVLEDGNFRVERVSLTTGKRTPLWSGALTDPSHVGMVP